MTFEEFDRLLIGEKVSFFDKETNTWLNGTFRTYTMNRDTRYAIMDITIEDEGCKQTYFGIDHKIVNIGWTKKLLKFRFHV